MPKFSKRSEERLHSCHEDLQKLLNEAIKTVDFTVLCGFRNKEDQDEAYRTGRSKVQYPNSKHNTYPSVAVDIAPYPVDWQDTARFARLVGYLERIGEELGISFRWGGDWDQDYQTRDERFIDMPHIELTEVDKE